MDLRNWNLEIAAIFGEVVNNPASTGLSLINYQMAAAMCFEMHFEYGFIAMSNLFRVRR